MSEITKHRYPRKQKFLEIDLEKLVYNKNRTVSWKKSYPPFENETKEEYYDRGRKLRSSYDWIRLSSNPERKQRKYEKDRPGRLSSEQKLKTSQRGKERYNEDRGRVLWVAARTRAKKESLEFGLDIERIRTLVDKGICQATGLPLSLEKKRGPYSPSIDRIDNTKGYIDSNIQIVCWGFNTAKNSFSMKDYIRICKSVIENFTEEGEKTTVISQNEVDALRSLQQKIYQGNVNVGWHSSDPPRPFAVLIALMHSELSEALEGDRKNLMDDHLPHRKMTEVELSDTIIRILDAGGRDGLDIAGALAEKVAYNMVREDHKREIRNQENGKKY